MRLRYALLFLICMLLPSSVLAEYYQYRDQNGVLRFTDNLADVPEDQRQQIMSYTESETFVMTEEESLEYLQDTSVQEETGEDMEGADQSEETGEDMESANQSEEAETARGAGRRRLGRAQRQGVGGAATAQRTTIAPCRQRFTRPVLFDVPENDDSIIFVVPRHRRNVGERLIRLIVNMSSKPSRKLAAAEG